MWGCNAGTSRDKKSTLCWTSFIFQKERFTLCFWIWLGNLRTNGGTCHSGFGKLSGFPLRRMHGLLFSSLEPKQERAIDASQSRSYESAWRTCKAESPAWKSSCNPIQRTWEASAPSVPGYFQLKTRGKILKPGSVLCGCNFSEWPYSLSRRVTFGRLRSRMDLWCQDSLVCRRRPFPWRGCEHMTCWRGWGLDSGKNLTWPDGWLSCH